MSPEIASRLAWFLAEYALSKVLDGALGYLGPRLPGLIPSLPPIPPSHYPWRDAGATPARRAPLALDLNRDGKVELKNAAFFDMNANGFHEKALLH